MGQNKNQKEKQRFYQTPVMRFNTVNREKEVYVMFHHQTIGKIII
jgi:hypothetical protein